MELQPEWAKGLVRLGDAYLASGQEADAVNAYSEAVQKAEGLVKTGTLIILSISYRFDFLTTRHHRGPTEIGFAPFEITIPSIEVLYLVNSWTSVDLSHCFLICKYHDDARELSPFRALNLSIATQVQYK